MPGCRMFRILYAQDGRGWAPGITDIGSRAEELVVVPIPVLRNGRGCQREAREMKPHPGAAFVHVTPESFALKWSFRPSIQEYHHLISSKHVVVEISPTGGRAVCKIHLGALLREPSIRFVYEADVRLIAPACVKCDYTKSR